MILKGVRCNSPPQRAVHGSCFLPPSQTSGSCVRNLSGALWQVRTAISWPMPSLSIVLKASKVSITLCLNVYVPVCLQLPLSAPSTALESVKRLAKKPGKKEHVKLHQRLLFLLESHRCDTKILDRKDRNRLLLWLWALDLTWGSMGGTGIIQFDLQWPQALMAWGRELSDMKLYSLQTTFLAFLPRLKRPSF